MNFQAELEKIGLTEEQYQNCLDDIADKLNGIQDIEWEEIKDKYNLPWAKDVLRKSSGTLFGGHAVYEWMKKNRPTDNDEISERLREIKREKQKLSDERAAMNKKCRESARAEENLAMFEEALKESGKVIFETHSIPSKFGNKDIIACVSDVHLGLDTNNSFGIYNAEVAQERLGKYLNEIVDIGFGCENLYIVLLGDLISGNIHVTTQLENRENAVQQVQKISELLSSFTYELSNSFRKVYVASVGGNHSRIGEKQDVLRTERLDDLVPWYMKAKLSHIDNIEILENKIDPTIGEIEIRGHKYLLCHGDFDKYSEAGVSKLVMMLGYKPTAVFYGHLHHCSYDDIAGVKIIRSGTFANTNDDYTISKRISGTPSQMVCIVDDKGVRACYPVDLS